MCNRISQDAKDSYDVFSFYVLWKVKLYQWDVDCVCTGSHLGAVEISAEFVGSSWCWKVVLWTMFELLLDSRVYSMLRSTLTSMAAIATYFISVYLYHTWFLIYPFLDPPLPRYYDSVPYAHSMRCSTLHKHICLHCLQCRWSAWGAAFNKNVGVYKFKLRFSLQSGIV
jgi:hypothetical protein